MAKGAGLLRRPLFCSGRLASVAIAALAAATAAVAALAGLLFRLVLVNDLFARLLIHMLHGEADLATVIEAEKLHLDLVALVANVRNLFDAVRCHLRDVDEAVARAEEVHEGAEIDDLHDRAFIDAAHFRLRANAAAPVDCRPDGSGIRAGHLDRATVGTTDRRARLLHDVADDLAARADDFADLVGRHPDDLDA